MLHSDVSLEITGFSEWMRKHFFTLCGYCDFQFFGTNVSKEILKHRFPWCESLFFNVYCDASLIRVYCDACPSSNP